MDFPLRLSKKTNAPKIRAGYDGNRFGGTALHFAKSVLYCSNSFFCRFDFAGSKLNSFSMKICSYVRNRTERAPVTIQMA